MRSTLLWFIVPPEKRMWDAAPCTGRSVGSFVALTFVSFHQSSMLPTRGRLCTQDRPLHSSGNQESLTCPRSQPRSPPPDDLFQCPCRDERLDQGCGKPKNQEQLARHDKNARYPFRACHQRASWMPYAPAIPFSAPLKASAPICRRSSRSMP